MLSPHTNFGSPFAKKCGIPTLRGSDFHGPAYSGNGSAMAGNCRCAFIPEKSFGRFQCQHLQSLMLFETDYDATQREDNYFSDISHLHDREMREPQPQRLGSAFSVLMCVLRSGLLHTFHFVWHRGEGSTQNHAKLFYPPSFVLHCGTVTVKTLWVGLCCSSPAPRSAVCNARKRLRKSRANDASLKLYLPSSGASRTYLHFTP